MAQYLGDIEDGYLPMEGERVCPKYLPHWPHPYDYQKYKDLDYNTCRDGEMTDILNSGFLNVSFELKLPCFEPHW